MEKVVTKRTLAEFRNRENPWKHRTPAERLAAMAVICGTNQKDGEPKPEFPRFYRLIKGEKVEYLLVGGYAVGLHGYPRYTGDIDFFVAISSGNAAKLVRVFEKFGFGDIGLSEQDFLRENYVVEIGREPNKIQVLTGIDGVTFDQCFARKISMEVDGMQLDVIGKDDLISNKAASGRPKDKLDLEVLGRI